MKNYFARIRQLKHTKSLINRICLLQALLYLNLKSGWTFKFTNSNLK